MTTRFKTLLFILLATTFWSGVTASPADAGRAATAWSALEQSDPSAARACGRAERRILKLMSVEQAQAFADGFDASTIELADGSTLAEALKGIPEGFDLSWWTIDSGGGTTSGDGYSLVGTIGQSDAGFMTGGNYSLGGGFLSREPLVPSIFADGFESGTTASWDQTSGGV